MKVLVALLALAAVVPLAAPAPGTRLPAGLRLQGPRRMVHQKGLDGPVKTEGGFPLTAKSEGGAPELRIINGEYADDYDRRFTYFALITMDESALCGGSIISETFILTAGQCVSGYDKFQVMMGNTNRAYASATYAYQFTNKAIVHEDFQEDTALNDIGLIELYFPVKFSVGIQPVRLPSAADVAETFVGKTATISGYGWNDFEFDSYYLRFVRQPVMDNARCKRFFRGVTIHNSLMCGDGEGRVGICTVDVGGPLVLADEDGGWTQIGIASFESSMGCYLGYPSVYTRLTAHLDWVRAKAGIAA